MTDLEVLACFMFSAQSVIISHPRMVNIATEWKSAAIQCDASGIPLPTITWEREGGVIPPTTTVLTSNDIPNRVHIIMIIEYSLYYSSEVLLILKSVKLDI